MPINWFTVVCELVNFLVLVWLLQRFLYKPILNAIDEREKGIAAELANAEAKQREAQQERSAFQQKNDDFDKNRAELFKRATDEANAERQRLIEVARTDADTLRAKRQEALRNERIKLTEEICRWTQKEVISTARKTLADLATVSLEKQLCEVFVQRLHEFNVEKKEQLSAALKKSNDSIRVRSAFDLPATQRRDIEKAVKDVFNVDATFQFEVAPDLVSGIELVADGQKVAWSITDYLSTLNKSLDRLLQPGAIVDVAVGPVTPNAKVNP